MNSTPFPAIVTGTYEQIDFLDYRVIKADDVSLKLLANQLAQNRSAENHKRIEKAIDNKGKKINDVMQAENTLAEQKEQNDSSKIEKLSLKDQINFILNKCEYYTLNIINFFISVLKIRPDRF